jgi:5-methyltetrahydrofolate--homocysteine methyltransferase
LGDKIDLTVPRLFDGAMGTELLKRGWPNGTSLEKWAVDHSSEVLDVHKAYLEAGAEVIGTCTFGANRVRLAPHGAADDVADINWSLARIAHQANSSGALIAGIVGPTGASRKSGGNLDPAVLKGIFIEQIAAIVDARIDLIAIETMTDIEEALAALAAAKEAAQCPVIVSVAFSPEGRLKDLIDVATAGRALQDAGADAVGCNCSPGGNDLIRVVEQLRAAVEIPILVRPSAGIPVESGKSLVYPLGVDDFGRLISELKDAGATMIGGCCGTTPDYVRSIQQEIGIS